MSAFKTILTTIVSTGIAGALMALPVRANEDNLIYKSKDAELTLSQNYYDYSDRPNNNEPANDFNKTIGLIGLAVGTGFVGWRVARSYKPSVENSIPALNNHNASLLDRVSPKLRQQLLRLVHNRQTADRLLSGTLLSHPNRSPNWLAEKVIYDLQRDR
ncbi:hypothetical protein [Myxosarcina sp. GI1]|uniref:hypothetical protein n=1 Tax=Myxosarcina sp. GI1 TaxID=1541065 RepID=UPI00055EF3F0|nr:hypothetical protein [Myxosarcina sp. GI1]